MSIEKDEVMVFPFFSFYLSAIKYSIEDLTVDLTDEAW
jgi:hypothetical protein